MSLTKSIKYISDNEASIEPSVIAKPNPPGHLAPD